MRDILIDQDGELRCAYCKANHFDHKRTAGSKVRRGGAGAAVGAVALGPIGLLGGAAALTAKKRLKCLACGKYNSTGNAQRVDLSPEAREAQAQRNAQIAQGSLWEQFKAGFLGN